MKSFLALFKEADAQSATVLLSGALLMTLFVYQGNHAFFMAHFAPWFGGWKYVDWLQHLYQFLASFVLFFLVPAGIVKFLFKKRLAEFGLAWGDIKFGLPFFLLSALVLPVALYLNARNPEFQAEYPLTKLMAGSLVLYLFYEVQYLLYYIGWEFFFRGYLQFGIEGRLPAFFIIMMQTLPSTIIHIGKPEGETLSAIVAGVVFGAVTLRTRSIVWVLLVHWLVGGLTDFFCLRRLGLL